MARPRGRAVGPADGDGPVELDDRRRRHVGQHRVERRDPGPVRLAVACAARAWQAAIEACSAYGRRAPPRAIARSSAATPWRIRSRSQRRRSWSASSTGRPDRIDPSRQSRGVQLHQRRQPVQLGLLGQQRGQDPAEPDGLGAQVGPGPVGAGRRGVPLVEDQVHDLADGRRSAVAAGRQPGARARRRRRAASAWPGRSVARRSPRAPGTPERSPRWTVRRTVAGSRRPGTRG